MTTPDRARAHIFVSGFVQGVFYRQSTADEAVRLGLTGWVRNLDDGRVEAVAEGERAVVEAWVAWCHRGPRAARVESVMAEWSKDRSEFREFRIEPDASSLR